MRRHLKFAFPNRFYFLAFSLTVRKINTYTLKSRFHGHVNGFIFPKFGYLTVAFGMTKSTGDAWSTNAYEIQSISLGA